MPTRALFLLLIAAGPWGSSRLLAVQSPDPQRPEVVWNVERRDLPPPGWRHTVAVGRGGTVWIGADADLSEEGGGLLLRKEGETWELRRIVPPLIQRTFVLDTDPAGGLWVAPFHPQHDNHHPLSPYLHDLRIQHFDGRRWSEERAPGFWPQAMDMISSDEGWIAGNHGLLLHRSGGRWKPEKLPGEAPQLVGKNFLALRMLSSEEGWAAGWPGLVARYHRGSWRILRLPPSLAREGFSGLDVTEEDGHVWLAGTRGVIARYDGRTWSIVRPAATDFSDIDMLSPSDGWAVGSPGLLFRYNGKTWSPQPLPVPGAYLNDIVMTSATEGWIVGARVVLRARAVAAAWQVPSFQDQSQWAGYSMARKPSDRAAVLDVDGDGDLDVLSSEGARISLFIQDGQRRFSEASRFPFLAASPQVSTSVNAWAWGDLDGDGDFDGALWGVPFGLQTFRNSGRGAFAATGKLEAGSKPGFPDVLNLLDLDRDGRIDLYLGARDDTVRSLYTNQGAGRFRLSSQRLGYRLSWDLGSLWGDLDGDQDVDVLVPGKGHRIVLYRNDGTGKLQEDPGGSGLELPGSWLLTRQSILVDLDRDGDLDALFVGNGLAAFVNDGHARFHRAPDLVPDLENNPFSGGFLTAGDLNHDGYPEILAQMDMDYLRRLHLLSRNPASQVYLDVTNGSGLEGLTGDAATLADLDDDGDLDLFLSRLEGSLILENNQNDANFLKVHLHGDRSNRFATGAQVRIYEAGRRDSKVLHGSQQMGIGFSPTGQQNLSELHFGLDASRRYDVEVLFPSGRRVVEHGVRPGRTLAVFESPFGVRQAVLTARWAQRAWLSASLPLETAKLGFVLLALALWRGPVARRLQARLFVQRWSLAAGFLLAYLIVAGELAEKRGAAVHLSQLLGLCGVLGLTAGVDWRLSRWRNRRYLGPFVLEKTLGQGGMGVVHRARHAMTGQTVALKVLHPQWIDREDLRIRFLREAQVLTRFEHPHIVRVFETGAVGDRGYISMELLKGMPLSAYLRQEGLLAPEIVVEVLLAACDALAHVHAAGLVHGDVKSANLFLLEPEDLAATVAHGWRPRIKLMDFGLARYVGTEGLDPAASLDGTPAYMSPEQLQRRPLDARSDLYSLGVVAYEALTGQLPFEGDREGSLALRIQSGDFIPLRQRRPEVSTAFERVLSRMLALSRTDRPASADELRALLRALRQGGDPGALHVTTLLRPDSAAPAVGEAAWQSLFRDAKIDLAEGRTTEGQVLLVECLAALGETLYQMPEEDREAYCQLHEDIAAALELNRRLSLGQGAQP